MKKLYLKIFYLVVAFTATFVVICFIWFHLPMPVKSKFDGIYSSDILFWKIKKPVSIVGKISNINQNTIQITNGGKQVFVSRALVVNDVSLLKTTDTVFIKIRYNFFIPRYEIFITNR